MRARPYVIVLGLIALLLVSLGQPCQAAASDNLVRVMRAIAAFNDTDFGRLKEWASEGGRRPSFASSQVDKIKINILELQKDDRAAVAEWLRGRGPQALYARGISSSQIRQTSEADKWRYLKFATETLQPPPSPDIQVLRGFAAVKKDGTSAQACVSFKNSGTKPATRVVFEFPLLNAEGKEDGGVLTLDRRGTFSPNIDIVGWSTITVGTVISGNRGMSDNCTTLTTSVAAVPFLSAQFAGYRIVRVEYTDGSSWVP